MITIKDPLRFYTILFGAIALAVLGRWTLGAAYLLGALVGSFSTE